MFHSLEAGERVRVCVCEKTVFVKNDLKKKKKRTAINERRELTPLNKRHRCIKEHNNRDLNRLL